jgi:hypothetical protein
VWQVQEHGPERIPHLAFMLATFPSCSLVIYVLSKFFKLSLYLWLLKYLLNRFVL